MSLSDSIGRFFDDPDLEKVSGFINGILSTPLPNKDTTSEQISSEFLSKVFEKEEQSEIENLLSQFSIPTERLQRYSAYEEIYKSVPMIKRIVKVYKPYIIQKNPVTGLWFTLKKTDYTKDQKQEDEQKAEDAKAYFNDVIENFDLQQNLKNQYIHNQLLYGDFYIEVVDLKKEKSKVDLKKMSMLTEVHRLEKEVENFTTSTSQLQIESMIDVVAEGIVSINEQIDESELSSSETLNFQNTILRKHKPHNIIVLETKYGTLLGYLEVNKNELDASNINVSQALSSITNRLISVSNSREDGNITSREAIINRIINHVLKKATGNNKSKYDESVIEDLKRFLIEQGAHKQRVNLRPVEVRFIPATHMIAISLPSSENHPHGGSLIESLMLPGKLFILSQLSNIFMKLSRAPLNRKWVIDSGSVQMPGQLLQKLKRELKNNRIAIEDMSSFKSISKIMSDYKDR